MKLTLFAHGVEAGFPSPADDYIEGILSLDEHLIKHPSATYFARANGNSMEGVGIFDKDLLIIDRAIEPDHGHIVVVAVDGQLTCKILDKNNHQLLSANNRFPPIAILADQDVVSEGVVTTSLRYHQPR
jgi:DNA polymerase V